MAAKKQRRAGNTETFSVSVDAETKAALRALADADYAGNLSAVITAFGDAARRRLAAGDVLELLGVPRLGDAEAEAVQAEVHAEIRAAATATKKRKKRRAA